MNVIKSLVAGVVLASALVVWGQSQSNSNAQAGNNSAKASASSSARSGGSQSASSTGSGSQSQTQIQGKVYAAIYSPGQNWIRNRSVLDQPLNEHWDYMERLKKQGIVLLYGPFMDNTGAETVFRAQNDEEALMLVQADPAIQNGVLNFELHPWYVR